MKIFRLFVAFTLICFVLLPNTQAVVPAPDGGYPGGNTAEGTQALFNLISGVSNTANGHQALFNNTIGSSNTAEGFRALFNNTTGIQNATGFNTLFHNTTGEANTAHGREALFNNTTGANNTANGSKPSLATQAATLTPPMGLKHCSIPPAASTRPPGR